MARIRKLDKPPIQEAVLDFHLANATADASALEAIANALLVDGWQKRPINTMQAIIGPLAPGMTANIMSSPPALQGYAIDSMVEQGRIIIQIREAQVTVSHLRPYRSWEDLEKDAERVLKVHVEISKANAITRIGTRYINRLELTGDDFHAFGQALMDPPRNIAGLSSGAITDFVERKSVKGIHLSSIVADTVVTIGTAAPMPGSELKGLLVDVDVSASCHLGPSIEAAKEQLTDLRNLKNAIFFGSVHDQALENSQ